MRALGPETTVTNVHFLVHPGFLGDTPAADAFNPLPSHRRLFDGYVNQAKKLDSDGIVVALLHRTRASLIAGAGNETFYASRLREMRSILGNRLIPIPADYPIEQEDTYLHARAVAGERGHVFDASVDSFAYGEVLGACVEEAAETANRALGLQRRTIVLPELSGVEPYSSTAQLPYRLADYGGIFDRIDYQLPRSG